MTKGRRRFSELLAGCLVLVASFHEVRAGAQEMPEPELEWHAPEGCPRRSDVIEEARRLWAAEPGDSQSGLRARARARVVRTEAGDWQLTLRVFEPASARRTLIGENCTAVARACALLLAMMMSGSEEAVPAREPSRPAEARRPVKAPEPAEEPLEEPHEEPPPAARLPPAEQLAPPEPTSPQKPTASHGVDGALGLRAAMDVGALPAARPGLGLTGELGWEMYRLRGWLGAYLPSKTSVAGVAGGEATFILAEGALQGCLMPAFGHLRVGPCLGAATGVLWATVTGVPEPESAVEAWVAPLAMLALRWPGEAAGLALEAAAGVAWPLRRPSFMLRQGEQVHQSDPVSLRVQLGASWQL